jgi:hypothetical protein
MAKAVRLQEQNQLADLIKNFEKKYGGILYFDDNNPEKIKELKFIGLDASLYNQAVLLFQLNPELYPLQLRS